MTDNVTQESPLPLTDPHDTGSVHAKYSISHHMVTNQTISLTRPSCWIQASMVGVTINSRSTTIRSLLWYTPANLVDSAWDNRPFQRYGWCPPKFKRCTWPNHAPFRNGLPYMMG